MKKIGLLFISSLISLASLYFVQPTTVVARAEENQDEAFSRENFLDSNNYKYTSTPVISENGITFPTSSTYQLPFSFERGFDRKIKYKFIIENLNVNESAWIVIHNNPDNLFEESSNTIPGLYFRINSTGNSSYRLDGFYTDGINYSSEMISGTWNFQVSANKDHTFQFETSLIQGYTDGIRVFYNGNQFGDWLCYSMVKNNVLTTNGKLYISTVGKITINNIVSSDFVAPKIEYIKPDEEIGYAGVEYEFGQINVTDNLDYNLDYSYKLFNESSKDITDKVYKNEKGRLCFRPLEIGEYSLKINTQDYSYNPSSKKILVNVIMKPHYPVFDENYSFPVEIRRNKKYYLPNVSAHDVSSENPDNEMDYKYEVYYYADNNKKCFVELGKDEIGYFFIPVNQDFNLTDGVGKYYVNISATNSYGTTYLEKELTAKYDIVDMDSVKKENIFNRKNWATSNYLMVKDDKVTMMGATYYKAGLNLEKGINISLSIEQLIDKGILDNWFSCSLLKHPGNAKYGDKTAGLHFMFFFQNGMFQYNMQYILDDGTKVDIKSNSPLYDYIPNTINIEVTPFDLSLDESMYDNISAFIDGKQIDSFEIYKIYRSEFTDDENFVYLSYGYYNGKESTTFNKNEDGTLASVETNNPIVSLTNIQYSDKTAPVISIKSEIAKTAKVGEKIVLPEAIAIDENDGEVEAMLSSVVAPNKKTITVINNEFTFKMKGTYIVKYIAVDHSGNMSEIIFEISVYANKKGCGGDIHSTSYILIPMVLLACFILFRKKKVSGKVYD